MNEQDRITSAIVQRFFQAIEMLIANRKIRGKKTITDTYGINRRNLIRLSKEPTRKFDLYYLWVLAHEYGVSSEWLITGRGDMFRVDLTAPRGWAQKTTSKTARLTRSTKAKSG